MVIPSNNILTKVSPVKVFSRKFQGIVKVVKMSRLYPKMDQGDYNRMISNAIDEMITCQKISSAIDEMITCQKKKYKIISRPLEKLGIISVLSFCDFFFLLIVLEITQGQIQNLYKACLLYTSPSPRDATLSRMPSSA